MAIFIDLFQCFLQLVILSEEEDHCLKRTSFNLLNFLFYFLTLCTLVREKVVEILLLLNEILVDDWYHLFFLKFQIFANFGLTGPSEHKLLLKLSNCLVVGSLNKHNLWLSASFLMFIYVDWFTFLAER